MRAVMAAIHRPIRCAAVAVRERRWIAGRERDRRRLPIDPDSRLVGLYGVARDIGPRNGKLQLALLTR